MLNIPSNIIETLINMFMSFLSFLLLAFGGFAPEPTLEGSVYFTKPTKAFRVITIFD